MDRQRKKKGSNDDWTHPHDPDAKITKMKDGRTHLAHKAEHAVDLETGAIVGITVQDADEGDTTTSIETLTEAAEQVETVRPRLLIHASGFNLGLLMRHLIGVGTPRGLQGRLVAAVAALLVLIRFLWEPMRRPERLARPASRRERRSTAVNLIVSGGVSKNGLHHGQLGLHEAPKGVQQRVAGDRASVAALVASSLLPIVRRLA
jgi:hypothetical protein